MSEVFLDINKAGQLYVDATPDTSITIKIIYKSGNVNFNKHHIT